MFRVLLITAFFYFLVQVSFAQRIKSSVSVVQLEANQELPINSVQYCLPKTFIKVDVLLTRNISKAGVFHEFSENMLNMNSISKDSENWEIKNVSMSTFGKADRSIRYAISASGDASAQFVSLTADGRLLGININNDKVIEFEEPVLFDNEISKDDISFDAVPFLEKQLKTTSLPAMASSSAEMIYKLRKRQLKMLGFEYEHHPNDMLLMKYSIEELKNLEIKYTELFTGKRISQTVVKSFIIDPNTINDDSGILFYFSHQKGVLDSEETESEACSFKINKTAFSENKSQSKEQKRDERGLVYNLPITIDFSILLSNQIVKTSQIEIAVPGVTGDVSPKILLKKGVAVCLDEKTGALKSIEKLGE